MVRKGNSMRSKWSPIAALGVMVCAAPAARAQECGWSSLSGSWGTGVSGPVWALTVFDDGMGNSLYAGGMFFSAGEETVNFIAKWDGSGWSSLTGNTGTGASFLVRALATFDDGIGDALYMGGSFLSAGGQTVNFIAKWDGTDWSPLNGPDGTGVSNEVYALAVFDDGSGGGPALYAGGSFTTAGGVTVNRIAKWDGTVWSALTGPAGTGVNDTILALAVFDDGTGPALYAGGRFEIAGGQPANRIARWDGSKWSPVGEPTGSGMNGEVTALTVFDDDSGSGPALYAGGVFTTADGQTVNGIAKWDNTAWTALATPTGTGVSGWVGALAAFDEGTGTALYTGGSYLQAGGLTANHIAKWDGTGWLSLAGPSETGVGGVDVPYIGAMMAFDDDTGPALYIGGHFTTAGGVTVNHIARWSCPASCGPADLDGDGVLGQADIVLFVTAFMNHDPIADFAEPYGVFDMADINAFVAAFVAGCP